MPLPLLALAAKLLPFAAMVPEVMRAFGSDKSADAAEAIVDVAKRVTGEADPQQAVNKIIADPALQLEYQKVLSAERLRFAEIEAEAEKHAGTQVTERWRSDMASDSRLSKNVRPGALVAILAMLGYALFQKAGSIDTAVLEILKVWGGLIISAYFLGRSGEKIVIGKKG